MWVLLLAGLIKLPIAALMLWIPFRYDESQVFQQNPADSGEDEGGSKALPGGPTNPHPRSPLPRHPRRGPHGSPSPSSPARMRTPLRATTPARAVR